MGYSGGSLKDKNAKRKVDIGGLVPEVSVGPWSIWLSGTELGAAMLYPGNNPAASCLFSEHLSGF